MFAVETVDPVQAYGYLAADVQERMQGPVRCCGCRGCKLLEVIVGWLLFCSETVGVIAFAAV
jgi:hypothetical protein